MLIFRRICLRNFEKTAINTAKFAHRARTLYTPFFTSYSYGALFLSASYNKAEGDLLEILEQADRHRVYRKHGHSSLFLYVVRELGLSESVAYNLITVCRKAREVPELRTLIGHGTITLSNARKISPVLTPQNKALWLEKAASLSKRQLEKEIVKVRPEAATPENVSYVTQERVRLEVGLSETDMLNLRRVQDLMSQAKGRSVTLEDVIVQMTGEYLKRHDPVKRAKRQITKKGKHAQKAPPAGMQPVAIQVGPQQPTKPQPSRVPIPANLLHQVRLRDQGRCTYTHKNGRKCNQRRFIETHHKIPVSQGGENTLENLTTLCSSHHSWIHEGGSP
ncbi:HNH endonuclease signature motif containing protein [Bdellovibrionota bacterium FG-2]